MIANPYACKYICFEGIDASGKSSNFTRFKTWLQAYHEKQFQKTFFTKQPDVDHPSGREIYELLQKRHKTLNIADLHSFEMQSRYFRNRIWHYRAKVIPNLAKEFHVISDRSVGSICFGVSSPKEFRPLMGIQEQAFQGAETPFIWPDAVLIYDVPSNVARQRMLDQGKELDAFERDINFQMRVRKNYLAFAEQYPNCHIIDGSGQHEEVFARTKEVIVPLLGL
jgi:dTMP kinase